MKVLYINYLYDTKYSSVGAAVHVKEFVNAARQLGVDIRSQDLNKFSGGEESGSQPKLRTWLKSKLSRYVGQLNALLSNVGYFRREWRLVSDENPDALLVRYNLLNVSAVLVAKLKKIPLVLEVNSPMALENRTFNKKVWHLPFLPEWFEKLNLKLATRVYTVSEALKMHFVSQGIDGAKISVIPNGVNVQMFHPEVDGQKIREQHKLGDDVVLGFVGSFHYWHGVDGFAPYVKRLCELHENVKFLLVGDGPLRADLESEFQRDGLHERVEFAGYVEHARIPEYLAAMDIVLAPYPKMTFFYFSPLKLFEYMAAGKPVIASRVGQIEEMIEHGSNGLLYEAGNLGELVKLSSRLVESTELRAEIGRQAWQTVRDHYSWKVNARRVMNLVEQSRNGAFIDPAVQAEKEGALRRLTTQV